MADENANLNSGDNKSEIACRLASEIWVNSDKHAPNIETKEEYLNLVAECEKALRGVRPLRGSR